MVKLIMASCECNNRCCPVLTRANISADVTTIQSGFWRNTWVFVYSNFILKTIAVDLDIRHYTVLGA